MTVSGVELKACDWMLSPPLAVATAPIAALGAREPAGVRAELDSETEISARLPEEGEQRDAMRALACPSLARLAHGKADQRG